MKVPYDYDELLPFAGMIVICYKSFGSYQGDWIAKVEYEGEIKWIKDYYGSCSGCDALLSEFNYDENVPLEKVVNFAKTYINKLTTYENVMEEASENIEWDLDAEGMIKWIEQNKDTLKS